MNQNFYQLVKLELVFTILSIVIPIQSDWLENFESSRFVVLELVVESGEQHKSQTHKSTFVWPVNRKFYLD